ncbi:uncharacterized protein PG986_003408 [Apiospora aurea]|uniref:WSC domain-containing protein n=1 Tax=Apiospora aurea TaxID=335848 RepID=A0ABR1QRL9_9PEZI
MTASTSAGPKATIQNDASGWTYAGCWADQPHQPVLAGAPEVSFGQPLTNDNCVRRCLVSGYTLAATSFGDRCLCGQFLNGTQKLDDASQCSTPCAGDDSQVCGGDWALSCYSPDGQARGWAQFGEQPDPEVLEPPAVLKLAVGGVGAMVVTVPDNVFPASGADLGQLQSRYGQSTQQPEAVLPSGVYGPGQGSSTTASTCQSLSEPTTGIGPGTTSPEPGGQGGTSSQSSEGSEPCSTTPTPLTVTGMLTTPCTSTTTSAPCSGVDSNPTLTLSPGAGGIVPRGGRTSTNGQGQDGTPSG